MPDESEEIAMYMALLPKAPRTSILVDAETFDDFGGWTLDSQFVLEVGSPYLLAHGNGTPVEDASTRFLVPEEAHYNGWIRTKDWIPGYHPGRFEISVNNVKVRCEFGANDRDWNWQPGDQIALKAGHSQLGLHDLTGINKRCYGEADLGGQLERAGVDNSPGPCVVPHQTSVTSLRRRMDLPMTQYWEYGQNLDPYTQGEYMRDHLLRAIYGTFSNVKTLEPDKYAKLVLDWVAFVPATGEFRRYKGDYVLNENDIREHRHFPDTVVQNDDAFCLHYGGHNKYDFRLRAWEWDERDDKPYGIPFRCLYFANIRNLMMAGKHISVTHIAGSNTKSMGNGARHAVAAAAAAYLCISHKTTPRELYLTHMSQLQQLASIATHTKWSNLKSRL